MQSPSLRAIKVKGGCWQIWRPSLELMVHSDVAGPLPANIGHGLPQSPRCPTSDGGLVFLSGGRTLGLEVATYLVEALSIDASRVLYIPHAYARPDEMKSLQDDFSGNVVEVRGRVYVRSCGPAIEPELVRRALACMIGGYSVAWLLGSDLPDVKPCSAVVPVFDGEGWAVLGQSILPAVKKH